MPLTAQQNAPNHNNIIHLLSQINKIMPIKHNFIAIKFEGKNLKLTINQYAKIFNNPTIGKFVTDQLIATYSDTLPTTSKTKKLLNPLIDHGIDHLPKHDLVYFYKVENTIFKTLSIHKCNLAIKQRLSNKQLSNTTTHTTAQINSPTLKKYYHIQYKTAKLNLTHKAMHLTPKHTTQIKNKINKKIFKTSNKANILRLIHTFENPHHTTNHQACKAGRTIINSILTIQNRNLQNTLIYFSSP